MDAIILYFIQANLGIMVFYLFYRLILHRDTFFEEKRFTVLLGMLFSALYPLIDLSSFIQGSKPIVAFTNSLSTTLPEILISGKGVNTESLTNQDLLYFLYVGIVGIFMIRIITQAISVFHLVLKGKKLKLEDQTIIQLPSKSAPFSFFGWIFVNPDEHSSADLIEILQHERAHVRQFHSFDALCSEIVCALFWINPFIWLLKNHLRANLEYLADKDVIHSGFDLKSYQYHLLRLSFQLAPNKINNGFNVSQLKNRIVMMNKKKTSLVGLCKYAFILPLFVMILLTNYACKPKNDKPAKVNTSVKVDTTKTTIKVVNKPMAEEPMAGVEEENALSYPDNLKKKLTDEPLVGVEQMPEFPGGETALMKFLSKNVHYPTSASEMGIQGRVIIRFVISKTGVVSQVEVIRGLNPACDKEAVRVVKMMPKWIPGKQNGRNVPVYFTLPIKYQLSTK